MDPVAFQVGPLSVRWYGILISMALALGTVLAYNEAKKQKINAEHILNLAIVAVPFAFIGARLYYVAFRWDFYGKNPGEIIAIWHGGLAIHGALIGGIIASYFYVKRFKLDFWKIADIVFPSIVLGQAIGRWGNFFNQEAHGGPVSREFISKFPKFIQEGMLINGQYYNPTFLYESLWDFGIFIFLLVLRRLKIIKTGDVFLSYAVLYSFGRFFIEGLRTDSLMLGPFRVAQVVSVIVIIGAGFLIYYRHRKAGRLE